MQPRFSGVRRCFSTWFAACGLFVGVVSASSEPRSPDEVLVRGRNLEIKQRDLDEMWRRIEVEHLNFGRIIPPDEVEFRQATLLDQMIFSRIAVARATENDRQKARERADK